MRPGARPAAIAAAPAADLAAASPAAPAAPTVPAPRPQPAQVRPVTAADLGATWRPGCPAAPEQLRRIDLDYWGFDGRLHRGQLVVDRRPHREVIAVFDRLLALRFPIERMQTADHYPGAEDELSMRDNNTSAYNCRDIPGTGNWSLHAYGRAVDINPRINPYIDGDDVQPANAGPWVDRSRTEPGMFHAGDPAVTAFTDRGWRWGGYWRSPKDYQHFEMR